MKTECLNELITMSNGSTSPQLQSDTLKWQTDVEQLKRKEKGKHWKKTYVSPHQKQKKHK